jgi:hypothetical protein
VGKKGPYASVDYFSTDVGSPEQKALFAKSIAVHYLPRGGAGGGSRDQTNSILTLNKQQYATATAQSPWAVEHFQFSFDLVPVDALKRIVCDDFPPCSGDLTPFLRFPPPNFVPEFYYPNYLSMAPSQGIAWVPNQVSTQSVFQQQPATTVHSYDGAVTSWDLKLSTALLQQLTVKNMSCPYLEAAVPNSREFARAGWYPRLFRVHYHEETDRFSVSMTHLQWRQSYPSKLNELSEVPLCSIFYFFLQVSLHSVMIWNFMHYHYERVFDYNYPRILF